jgi:glutamyl-tRNA synthetase
LGYPALEYAHLPLVLGPDKKRLSKRHAATSLEEYKDMGYLDSAILNSLARLGWSGGDKEVFYMDDLLKDFNIKDVQKAGAIFDITKLDWLNAQHLANLSLEEFKEHIKPFAHKINIDINDHPNTDLLISSMRTFENTLSDIAKALRPYFIDVGEYDNNAIGKFLSNGTKVLEDIYELLQTITDWNEEEIDVMLKEYQASNNLKVPEVNQPIRIALTGSTKSPSLGLTLSLFDKKESLKRIEKLISFLN